MPCGCDESVSAESPCQTGLEVAYQSMDLPSWLTSAISEIAGAIQKAVEGASWGSVLIGVIQGFLGIVRTLFAFMLCPFFLLPFFTFFRKSQRDSIVIDADPAVDSDGPGAVSMTGAATA